MKMNNLTTVKTELA